MSRVFDELVRVRELTPEFLHPHYERMHDALLLPDMKVAVERIRQAVKQQEPILIYGDYDVDGVTASTLLEQTLRLVGAKVLGIMLPHRLASPVASDSLPPPPPARSRHTHDDRSQSRQCPPLQARR